MRFILIQKFNQHQYIFLIHITKMRELVFMIIIVLMTRENKATNLQVPETFGLMTMTYTRGDDNSMFEGHLARYATMDCPIMTEVNIVWNNEKTPQQMGVFKNSQNWKRPVYFYLTPYNSLNWRYKIPKESKQRVYFYIDDDNIVQCSELANGFKIWQNNAIGEFGPIVSYHIRNFQYTHGKDFTYIAGAKTYYSIGLLSAAFVSAHIMELYYADIWELQEVRKIVTDKNNCEDIALDFIASFFYPQLLTKHYPGKYQGLQGKAGVSKTGGHMQKRSQCVQQFTYIFGFNAFRFQPLKQQYPNAKRWNLPFRNQTVLAKKQYFERDVLHKQGIVEKVKSIPMPIPMPTQLPETSVFTQKTEHILLFVMLAFCILSVIALWKMKKELSRKQNNSRVLKIQMDQPALPATQRQSMRNETDI